MVRYYGGSSTSHYNASLEASKFPSPFFDVASTAMPRDQTALDWCEYIFNSNGTYRQAAHRIVSYFLTDIIFRATEQGKELSMDEKDKWNALVHEDLNLVGHQQNMDIDLMCYGNSFESVLQPFMRFLVCPRCSSRYRFTEVADNNVFAFKYARGQFIARCPNSECNYQGSWDVKDEIDKRPSKIICKSWNPKEMVLDSDYVTGACDYYWRIPDDYKQQVRKGSPLRLANCPKEILEAINRNQQLFKFGPDELFHAKEPTLAGMRNAGWGISRTIVNFRQNWFVQLLRRQCESICLDYIIPLRVITPASGARQGTAGEPLGAIRAGDFVRNVRRMIRQRRFMPSDWYTLPYPLQYQMLGAEANQIVPVDMMQKADDDLLNAIGAPPELYRSTLTVQAAPVALRLFESSWTFLTYTNNAFLRWFVRRVTKMMSWEAVQARHQRVTHADDMQKHMAILQMAMGGSISLTTALRMLGLDYQDEQRTMGEEARFQQEEQANLQEEMAQAAFGQQLAKGGMPPGGGGGAPPPGGAPAGGGGAPPQQGAAYTGPVTNMVAQGAMPQTPEEIFSTAESLARELFSLPSSVRNSELRTLKQKNQLLHAATKQMMVEIRGNASSQGQAQLMAQEFGGAA